MSVNFRSTDFWQEGKPEILDPRGALVQVTLGSICTSCDCAEIRTLIEAGKIDTTLITHGYTPEDIEEAYRIFENKLDGVIKIAVTP